MYYADTNNPHARRVETIADVSIVCQEKGAYKFLFEYEVVEKREVTIRAKNFLSAQQKAEKTILNRQLKKLGTLKLKEFNKFESFEAMSKGGYEHVYNYRSYWHNTARVTYAPIDPTVHKTEAIIVGPNIEV